MDFGSVHYNSIAVWLKSFFGCRVVKLSLDGGFTCPNRDGSCGTGGCSFCSESGSGDFTGSIEEQIKLLKPKWGEDNKYIAYFQNHTNTYAPVSELRSMWDEALSHERVVGLAAATRPDCLGDDVLELLSEYNRKTFLWVELGLQTSNENTARAFNRCYDNKCFEEAAEKLSSLGIRFVVHIIIGLPGEDRADFINSALYAAKFRPFGIKLHALHLMKGTAMGSAYISSPWELLSLDAYVEAVCDILERLPGDITVHRLTGDAPGNALIAPLWTKNKHNVLNAIQKEFKRRRTYQGVL